MTPKNTIKSIAVLIIIGLLLSFNSKSATEYIELTPTNHISIIGPVNAMSIAKAQFDLIEVMNNNPKEVFLVINSDGGSVEMGTAFIELLNGTSVPVHGVCITCMSMAYHIFQSTKTRYVLESSTLMTHPWSAAIEGNYPGNLETQLADIVAQQKVIFTRDAKRLGLTYEQFLKLIAKDYYVRGKNAIVAKHADKLAVVSCSSELLNTFKPVFDFTTGTKVQVSGCPLIISELSPSGD